MFFYSFADEAVVHPDSDLQNVAHVYKLDGKLYSVNATKVDLSPEIDKNSYYILQLLESDDDNPKR